MPDVRAIESLGWLLRIAGAVVLQYARLGREPTDDERRAIAEVRTALERLRETLGAEAIAEWEKNKEDRDGD